MSIAKKAVDIAADYIGEQEEPKGSNWGQFVKECLKLVGIQSAAPWCMAFVYRCYSEAAGKYAECPVVKTGGVMDCWAKTEEKKKQAITKANAHVIAGQLKPGDQIIMNFGKGRGHTGIVEKVVEMLIYTIEGNTNEGVQAGSKGDREGWKVCRRVRDVKSLHGVIRYEGEWTMVNGEGLMVNEVASPPTEARNDGLT
ncbi:CHAP domain-containing protein [bacterium]|nr:CHAP domain-containing protein [bacterium]